MTRNRILGLFMGVSLLCVIPVRAQESKPASERPGSSGRDKEAGGTSFAVAGSTSREAQAAAPRVLKFNGVLLDASGKPLSGEVEVTFALYKQEGDEEPLWTETQHLAADESGGYTALLGLTQCDWDARGGVPVGRGPLARGASPGAGATTADTAGERSLCAEGGGSREISGEAGLGLCAVGKSG